LSDLDVDIFVVRVAARALAPEDARPCLPEDPVEGPRLEPGGAISAVPVQGLPVPFKDGIHVVPLTCWVRKAIPLINLGNLAVNAAVAREANARVPTIAKLPAVLIRDRALERGVEVELRVETAG